MSAKLANQHTIMYLSDFSVHAARSGNSQVGKRIASFHIRDEKVLLVDLVKPLICVEDVVVWLHN